jgi:signal transduction histidine kinase
MAAVLVVDDERSVREAFTLFLERDGHNVWSAGDAGVALELLKEQLIDVVVSDIILPSSSGVELLEAISKGWPTIRVILITGEPSIDTAARAVRAGAHDYLTKPVTADELQRAVATAVRLKSMRDRNRRLRQALLDSNREYEALCARMADEIGQPLKSILVSASALGAGLEKDRTEREIERIRTLAVQLNQLLQQIRSLATASHQRIRPRIVDLQSLARDVAAELRIDYPHHPVELVLGEDLVASGDPGLLREAVYCLLDNAWRFTSPKGAGRVEFKVEQPDGQRTFSVRDNGVGFSPEPGGRLFRAFETAHERGLAGSGTGLAIARRIIQRHGGELWADAVPGEGATFSFTLGSFP